MVRKRVELFALSSVIQVVVAPRERIKGLFYLLLHFRRGFDFFRDYNFIRFYFFDGVADNFHLVRIFLNVFDYNGFI